MSIEPSSTEHNIMASMPTLNSFGEYNSKKALALLQLLRLPSCVIRKQIGQFHRSLADAGYRNSMKRRLESKNMEFHEPHKEQDMDYRELANSAHHAPQQLSRAQAKARSLLNVADTKVKSQPARPRLKKGRTIPAERFKNTSKRTIGLFQC